MLVANTPTCELMTATLEDRANCEIGIVSSIRRYPAGSDGSGITPCAATPTLLEGLETPAGIVDTGPGAVKLGS